MHICVYIDIYKYIERKKERKVKNMTLKDIKMVQSYSSIRAKLETHICLTLKLEFFTTTNRNLLPSFMAWTATQCPRMGRACPHSWSPVLRCSWTQDFWRDPRGPSFHEALLSLHSQPFWKQQVSYQRC